jgi:hypothetical protein
MIGRDLFYFRAVKGSVLSGRLLSLTAIKTERRTPPVTIADLPRPLAALNSRR